MAIHVKKQQFTAINVGSFMVIHVERTIVERAGQLADVAAHGVAASVHILWDLTLMVGVVVSSATAHVNHRRPVGGYGMVGAGSDTTAALGAVIGTFSIL